MSGIAYSDLPPETGAGGGVAPQDIGAILGGAQPEQHPGPDPLGKLQDAIHSVAEAVAAPPDPQDTQEATACLLALTKIQTRLMQGGGGAPPQG